MNIDNPIQPILINPAGVDVNIETLRIKMETLSWVERSFGRAVALYENPENPIRVPKIPLGGGEYFNCMPNDTQKAFSFFYPVGALKPIGDQQPFIKTRFFSQRVDLYIWANLKRIDSSDIGLGEKLKENVIQLISDQKSTVIEKIWSDDIQEVYNGWKLDQLGRDLLYWPYYAMRFELTLKVTQNDCK